jgi:hypothetical protein
VQLGLSATPRRTDNTDIYAYFGDPVFIYSLKEGINDGFLTPFRVKQITTTLDEYVYTPDDTVVEGEIEAGKRLPSFSSEREAELRRLGGEQGTIDYSHLRRTPSLDRLKDQLSLPQLHPHVLTTAWQAVTPSGTLFRCCGGEGARADQPDGAEPLSGPRSRPG